MVTGYVKKPDCNINSLNKFYKYLVPSITNLENSIRIFSYSRRLLKVVTGGLNNIKINR